MNGAKMESREQRWTCCLISNFGIDDYLSIWRDRERQRQKETERERERNHQWIFLSDRQPKGDDRHKVIKSWRWQLQKLVRTMIDLEVFLKIPFLSRKLVFFCFWNSDDFYEGFMTLVDRWDFPERLSLDWGVVFMQLRESSSEIHPHFLSSPLLFFPWGQKLTLSLFFIFWFNISLSNALLIPFNSPYLVRKHAQLHVHAIFT